MSQRKRSNRTRNYLAESLRGNKLLSPLLNTVLILIIILLIILILPIFQPLIDLFKLFAFPIIGGVLLFYIFSPLVNRLSKAGINRHLSILSIFVLILALLVWGGYALIPILREQTLSFIENTPSYINEINKYLESLPFNLDEVFLNSSLQEFFATFDWNAIGDNVRQVVTTTFGGLGSVIGTVTQFVVGLITLPVVLYYLLLDGSKFPKFVLYHMPNRYREKTRRIFYKVHEQISGFIQGTITVALSVAFIFWVGYKLISLEYAFLLAFLAGIFNVVPYLGSIFSTVPALLIALVHSPYMVLKVLIVLAIEQFIESRILQPFILGSTLSIHPLTILLVILAGGRLFGVAGVLLAVPTYAILKVIFKEIYYTFRENSDLYESEDEYDYHEDEEDSQNDFQEALQEDIINDEEQD